ncbi:MAG: FAD-dependent oxidoreductase [Bacilli bacterium]|nr:FAD-dependent oxidoreductase [Bacilli bacterium]
MNPMYDCVIIGAGPAGLSSALYFGRAKVNVALIEKSAPGGKVITTSVVENYPGVLKTTGADLALVMLQQIKEFKIPTYYTEVLEVIKNDDYFIVKTASEELTAKFVLSATGTINRTLNVPGEMKFMSRGISYCAICDGKLYENKEVLVIGGGNSAFEESLYLAKLCKKVTLIHRTDQYRAQSILVEKVKNTPNIELIPHTTVTSFNGTNRLESVNLKTNEETRELKVDGAFIYIGYLPATAFLKDLNVLNEAGFIEVDGNYQTKVEGLYGVGDCINHPVKQIATAVGDAVCATNIIIKKL